MQRGVRWAGAQALRAVGLEQAQLQHQPGQVTRAFTGHRVGHGGQPVELGRVEPARWRGTQPGGGQRGTGRRRCGCVQGQRRQGCVDLHPQVGVVQRCAVQVATGIAQALGGQIGTEAVDHDAAPHAQALFQRQQAIDRLGLQRGHFGDQQVGLCACGWRVALCGCAVGLGRLGGGQVSPGAYTLQRAGAQPAWQAQAQHAGARPGGG